MTSKNQKYTPSIYTLHNKVQLVRGGKHYFDLLLEMIEQSQQVIHLQSYIYDDDETGNRVADWEGGCITN